MPLGIDEPRYLKRPLLDGVFYTSALNTLTANDYSGSPPTWLSTTVVAADFNGSSSASMQYGWSVVATLAGLPNAAEITNFFREYQIVKMDLKIELCCGDSYNSGAGSPLCSINCAYDPSDNTPATSYPAQIQYANNKAFELVNGKPILRKCVPKSAQSVFSSAIATGYGYSTGRPLWLDCNIPLVPHYAFKLWTRGQIAVAGSGFAFRVTPTLHVMMRRPR